MDDRKGTTGRHDGGIEVPVPASDLSAPGAAEALRLRVLAAVRADSGECFVVTLTSATAPVLSSLVPAAASLSLRPRARTALVLDVPGPGDEGAAGGTALTFQQVEDAMPETLRRLRGRVVRVRTRAGRPACRLPEAAQVALLDPGARAQGGGTWGPSCAECAVRPACGGVTAAYARAFGTGELRPLRRAEGASGDPDWQQKVRWLLTDRPLFGIPLGRMVPPGLLAGIRCTRPWTRLTLHSGGTFGPCCTDHLAETVPVPPGATAEDLWRARPMDAFRAEMRDGRHPAGCRPACPVLRRGAETPDRLVLRGGSADAVEDQIRRVEAMLLGRRDAGYAPESVSVPVTTGCNYRCLMCECGETGNLADEHPASFWDGISRWMDLGTRLDAKGGEPLASPAFRAFLVARAASAAPSHITLITNGSLLTPAFLQSLPRIPFDAISVSLNAASAATYRAVNRGAPWAVIRRNLDALLEARRAGRYPGDLAVSFVVLRANLHEVRAFARMGLKDEVRVRYLLPQGDLHGQSILTSADAMEEAEAGLRDAAGMLEADGQGPAAAEAREQAAFLGTRRASGLLQALAGDE